MNFSDFKNANGFEIDEHFESKLLSDLSIEELAYIHLNRKKHNTEIKCASVSSSLFDLIETAQASFINYRTRIYTPLLACFAVLDQIGGAYGSQRRSVNASNGIKLALNLFGSYTDDEIKYLVTLRNGLYHDGSLISKSRDGRTNVVFRLDPDSSATLTMPQKPWDGTYHDSLGDNIARINVRLFKDDVEKIALNCQNELLDGTLIFKIQNTREFFYKFLFAVS